MKKTLRTRVVMLLVAALVPLFGLSIFKALHNAEAEMERAKGHLQFAASLAAASQERVADSARQVLTVMASLPGMQDGKNVDCDRYFSSLIQHLPEYANMGIMGLDGYTRCHALGSDKKAFLGDRAYLRNAITQRRFVVGTYVLGRLLDRPVLTFAQPVIGADDKVTGVIFASVDLVEMAKSIEGIQLPPGAALGIQDRNGTLLAGKPALPIQVGQKVRSPVLQEAVKALSTGVREGLDGAGRDRLWAFLPSSPHTEAAVFMSVSMDRDLIVGPSRRQLWLELVTLALTAFLGGWLAWMMGGRAIVKPTTELLEATRQLQQGQLDVRIPISEGDDAGEFSRIAAGFNRMAESLQTQRAALEAELARSQAIQEKMQDAQRLGRIGYWQSDLDTRMVWWSDEVYEVLGVERAVLGNTYDEFLQRVHPDDREAYGAGRNAATQAGMPRNVEYRVVTSAGEVRWIHQFGRAHVNAEGEQGRRRAGVIQDITERKHAEEMLRESNDRFQTIFKQAPMGIAVIDSLTGKIVEANATFANIIERTPEEMATINWMTITHPDDLQEDLDNMARLNAGEIAGFQMNKRYLQPNGSVIWISMTIAPILIEDKIHRHHLCMIEDITEQHKSQEQMRLLETCIFHLNDMVVITEVGSLEEPGNRIVFVNDAFERCTGYSRQEVLGQSPRFLRGPNTQRDEIDRIDAAIKKWQPVRAELINYTKGGQEYWIELDIVPIADATGRYAHWVAVERDITERKQAEEMLRKSNYLLKVIVENAPIRIFWKDLELRYLGGNTAFAHDAGLSNSKELIGKDDYQMAWREQADLYRSDDRRVIDSDMPKLGFEESQSTPHGHTIWLRTSKVPIHDAAGKVNALLGIYEDITERKLVEQALIESEQRYATLFEAAPVPTWVFDSATHQFLAVNQAAIKSYGYSAEEFRSMTIFDIRPESEHGHLRQKLTEQVRWRKGKWQHRRKDGSVFPVEAFSKSVQHAGRAARFVVALDISDQVKAEKEVAEHLLMLQRGADAAQAVNWYQTLQGTLQEVAKQARGVIGTHQAAVIFTHDSDWAQAINAPSLSEKYAEYLEQFEPVDGCGIRALVCETNRPLRLTQAELEAQPRWRGYGSQHPPMRGWLAVPLMARDGKNIGLLQLSDKYEGEFTQQDEYVAMDLARLASSAIENSRLIEEINGLNTGLEQKVAERTTALRVANQELEAFSYSVSHDLRSPLNTVDGFSQLLAKQLAESDNEKVRHYLSRIRAGTAQMGQLIGDLLSLAQVARTQMNHEPVDLSALSRGILDDLQARQPERQVALYIEPGLQAQGDAGLLRVVVENLLGNAWKYSSKQAEAEISIGQQLDAEGSPVFFVRDNGAGFDMAYADKLFQPFQRLHAVAEFFGTGIGLATVSRVIERHGGRIWADALPGYGATFFFTLPKVPLVV